MKNLIKNQPKEIQVILSCICRKWQSDFLDKSIYQKKRKNADYKRELARDRAFIEKLTEAIEGLNNGHLFTQYGTENIDF